MRFLVTNLSLVTVFFLNLSCSSSKESVEQPQTKNFSDQAGSMSLKGTWVLEESKPSKANKDLKVKGPQFEFDGQNRVKIYMQEGNQANWIEVLYSFSETNKKIIIYEPDKISKMEFSISTIGSNTISLSLFTARETWGRSESATGFVLTRVENSQTIASKAIALGIRLEGKPLGDLPATKLVPSHLLGAWELIGIQDRQKHITSLAKNSPVPKTQIVFDDKGNGGFYTASKDLATEIPYQFIFSPAAQRVFLFEQGAAGFAEFFISSLDETTLAIKAFHIHEMKLAKISNQSLTRQILTTDTLIFKKVSADLNISKSRVTKYYGIPEEYQYGFSINELKPLYVWVSTPEVRANQSSPDVFLKFDQERAHCKYNNGVIELTDNQEYRFSEDGITYVIKDDFKMSADLGDFGTRKYSEFVNNQSPRGGSLELYKSITKLGNDSQFPDAELKVRVPDLKSCTIRAEISKGSRLSIEMTCGTFEQISSNGITYKILGVKTVCEYQ